MEILSGPATVVVETSTRVAEAAGAITDPIGRAQALKAAAANIPHLQQQLRLQRAEAIREAIAASSATAVAAELGISRTMLYKILSSGDEG